MKIVGSDLTLLCIGPNCWAKGTTEQEACKKAFKFIGLNMNKTRSYQLYVVSPETVIDADGCFSYKGMEPILVKAVRKGVEVDPSKKWD
jgi:hypothetical protein